MTYNTISTAADYSATVPQAWELGCATARVTALGSRGTATLTLQAPALEGNWLALHTTQLDQLAAQAGEDASMHVAVDLPRRAVVGGCWYTGTLAKVRRCGAAVRNGMGYTFDRAVAF